MDKLKILKIIFIIQKWQQYGQLFASLVKSYEHVHENYSSNDAVDNSTNFSHRKRDCCLTSSASAID